MRIWYDTEFLERGNQHPIIPVSIGMVREDGETLYIVNRDAPVQEILDNEWLRLNVWPHIKHYFEMPTRDQAALRHGRWEALRPLNDWGGPIQSFCAGGLEADEDGIKTGQQCELWAYYADYDHVVLAQSFGLMINLPDHIPMYTRDLKQAVDMLLGPGYWFPEQESAEHDALSDALECRNRWEIARRAVMAAYNRDLLSGERPGRP